MKHITVLFLILITTARVYGDINLKSIIEGSFVSITEVNPVSEINNKWIKVSLKHQRIYCFDGEKLIYKFKVSTGTSRHRTPLMTTQIFSKRKMAYSRRYHAYMPYWMQISSDGGYGLHSSPLTRSKKPMGLNLLGRPASHGCVRIDPKGAPIIFKWAPVGTKVMIVKE